MLIRRALLLCLIALALVFTGPFARGLSAAAAPEPLATDLARAGVVSDSNSGWSPYKRCQRGAVSWATCSADTAYPPGLPPVYPLTVGRAFGPSVDEPGDSPRANRIFRPPRLS